MRKKVFIVILFCLVVSMAVCMITFSARTSKPKQGVFYCEELRISIDFTALSLSEARNDITNKIGKRYNEDGTYEICRCLFTYGTGVGIVSLDQKTTYLKGDFAYWFNICTITSYEDGTVYTFVLTEQ